MPKGEGSLKFEKYDAALNEILGELLAEFPAATRRIMFGCPCAFINGSMFAGVFGDKLFLRLNPPDLQEFLALPDTARFGPMPGRPMKEYATAGGELLAEPRELLPWLRRSFDFAKGLPPKVAKPKQPKQSGA